MTTMRRATATAPTFVIALWAMASGAGAAEVRPQVLGDAAAPVTIVEYASLTCPHCAAFHRDVLPELKSRYIDPGSVKLEFRDFPLDAVAAKASVIAHCGGDARFFAFVGAFFGTQERWSHADDPVAALKQIALPGGLTREQVDACLADPAMETAVLQMRLDGQNQFRIQSTPSFLVNGQLFSGTRSVEAFAAVIDPLLGRTAAAEPSPAAPPTASVAAPPASSGEATPAAPPAEPAGFMARVWSWVAWVLSSLGLA